MVALVAKPRRAAVEAGALLAVIPAEAAVAEPRAAFPTVAEVGDLREAEVRAEVAEECLAHPIGCGHSLPG